MSLRACVLRSGVAALLCVSFAPAGEDHGYQAVATAAEARAAARLEYWSTKPQPWNYLAGHVHIEYGQPRWNKQYDGQFDSMTKGKRWRFGQNFWTSLDATMPFTLGDQEVEAGYYYLTLERGLDGTWELLLLDPMDTQEQRMGNWQVAMREVPEVFRVPVAASRSKDKEQFTELLTITFQPEKGNDRKGHLDIAFGPHRLRTAFQVEL